MTMYSDDPSVETPQPKQPRVIILPGERQDIFTTSGLQKAAKVYESGEEREGKLTTDRSRRLLESAGMAHKSGFNDAAPPEWSLWGMFRHSLQPRFRFF